MYIHHFFSLITFFNVMSPFSVTDVSGAIMQQQARPNKWSGHCTCATQNVRAHVHLNIILTVFLIVRCTPWTHKWKEIIQNVLTVLICVIYTLSPFELHNTIIYANFLWVNLPGVGLIFDQTNLSRLNDLCSLWWSICVFLVAISPLTNRQHDYMFESHKVFSYLKVALTASWASFPCVTCGFNELFYSNVIVLGRTEAQGLTALWPSVNLDAQRCVVLCHWRSFVLSLTETPLGLMRHG